MTSLAGECLMVGFRGSRIDRDSAIAKGIKAGAIGGVILFDRHLATKSPENNIINPEQTRRLAADLKDLAQGDLLIAVDQEGGAVSRFQAGRGFPASDRASVLGAHADTGAMRAAAQQTAKMLAELGINFNLAPVVDVNSNPENPIIGRYGRSFGDNPETVARHAAVWIEEHRRRGIACCLKHFPGHGSSRHDSHLGFCDISDTWDKKELLPFQTLINQGLADAVMSGHLFHRGLDEEFPATLSPAIIGGLLRRELTFDGVVISDDMQMAAITSRFGFAEAVSRAMAAGIDIVLVGNNLIELADAPDQFARAIDTALRRGQLTEQRIEEARRRIRLLKQS
jgi:beta-N-acetylhexosaminidase